MLRPQTRRAHIIALASSVMAIHNITRVLAETSTQSLRTAQDILTKYKDNPAFATAAAYVMQFYPLWFTYYQSTVGGSLGVSNDMVAAARISPIYHYVVAINYDTLYASVYLDVSTEPVILTIPETVVPYSILLLDPYGNTINSGLPTTPGVYALTGPGYSASLPQEVTRVSIPLNFTDLYFRAVKYSPAGQNLIPQASAFQASLKTQTLSEYQNDPNGGNTKILPERYFAVRFKQTADNLIANTPIIFLQQLQKAVAAPNTPPMSAFEQQLSAQFDMSFCNGDNDQADFSAGTQKAHSLLIENYLSNTGQTNWIHFTNIANWGDAVVDRASITEYLQLANGIDTAAYYHVFKDGSGEPLDGSNPSGYVLTFPADQLPDAQRFWSLTAYTPDAIELVPNSARKYVVASYTPGLTYNPDGSLSVYMATSPPEGMPTANWLPVPPGEFNIMLRVYGPAGDVADNSYVPPGIQMR